MKLRELLVAQPALQELNRRKMPVKLAYAMAKNFRLVNQELEDYEKARVKMLQDNWKVNPETNKYEIPPEDDAKATVMFDELLDEQVDLPTVIKVTLTQLEGMELSPGEVEAISWMIEE